MDAHVSLEGQLSGMYFPPVPVGTYKSKATGTCRGATKSRTQAVSIVEKTLD
jgi:hypothetical protein